MISFRSIREEYEAKLTPAVTDPPWAAGGGKAEWKLDSAGAMTLKLRLRKLACPDGTRLLLAIGHRDCGEVTVERGRGEIAWDSREGDAVPEVRADYLAELRHDGETVLQGIFARD